MQLKARSSRALALLTGGVIAASTFFHPAPAQADKAKTYKYGAIGLGILGAYMLSKGKTVPGAAAVAGGVYAYKKSRDAERNDRYDDGRYNDRYGRAQDRYPQYNSSYPDYNSNYPQYNSNAQYNPRYTDNNRDRDEQCNNQGQYGQGQYQRNDRRDSNRGYSRSNGSNYDLSPYLR